MCSVVCSSRGGVSSCPLVQRSAGFRGFRTCRRLALVLLWCVPCLLPAFLLYACRAACEYGFISRFKGRFWRVLGCRCIFVWVEVFAWIVWLLCACIVRRLYGLWRVCLYYISFAYVLSLLHPFFFFFAFLLSSFLSFCSCVCLSFYLFAPAFFVCPLVLCLSSLSLWVVVSFSLTDYTQKERARRVGASSLVLLWVCLLV